MRYNHSIIRGSAGFYMLSVLDSHHHFILQEALLLLLHDLWWKVQEMVQRSCAKFTDGIEYELNWERLVSVGISGVSFLPFYTVSYFWNSSHGYSLAIKKSNPRLKIMTGITEIRPSRFELKSTEMEHPFISLFFR